MLGGPIDCVENPLAMSRTPIAKLTPPRIDLVSRRPRVEEALRNALRSGLCWLAAPSGYGKTTAAAEYVHGTESPLVWYRVDEGDRDIAGFFYYLAASLPKALSPRLPIFGQEYADQPQAFARRFFREYFSLWNEGGLLVLDDLHYADHPTFNAVLEALRTELPEKMACLCISRNLPPANLAGLRVRGRLDLVDENILRFTDDEADAMVAMRSGQTTRDIGGIVAARGWAIALMLLANRGERATAAVAAAHRDERSSPPNDTAEIHALIEREWFGALPENEANALLRLGALPKITLDIAGALVGEQAPALLQRLQQRQMLVTRGTFAEGVFHLHDLLRDFLRDRLDRSIPAHERTALRRHAAELSWAAGRREDAIELALQAPDADQAAKMIVAYAPELLEQGRRVTLSDWCRRLPPAAHDAWLCYWLGVAHMADDADAERWLEQAWLGYSRSGDTRGRCLTAARAVLSKTDSWRTHAGLHAWTQRAIALADASLPTLDGSDELLVLSGFVRAFDYAEDYRSDGESIKHLTMRLIERIAHPHTNDSPSLRLLASGVLIDQAGSNGDAHTFEYAVDSVAEIVGLTDMPPWPLGMWLIAFGAVSGKYFPYARRDFAYSDAESALREAIAIGVREELRGVEFGALYHLQLQMKLRNDFSEWPKLIDRLSAIADSRYTTQAAVVADCRAALHARCRDLEAAQRECERFNRAIEAANEPPIERWPHYITEFQVLLAADEPEKAASLLERHLDMFDGIVRARTEACIAIARTLHARDDRAPTAYLEHLKQAFERMRFTGWYGALINLPETLSAICADAIEAGIESGFCNDLIRRRRLSPPPSRPPHWPWPLRVRVLGEFALELDGAPLALNAKAPARSLDILRALAVEKSHSCAIETLCDRFWPDADGDRARAACEQAVHRLRKLLGSTEFVSQREGRLRLAMERIWIDLDHWETRLKRSLAYCRPGRVPDTEAERTLLDFPGGLLGHDPAASWCRADAERLRGQLIDLALGLGAHHECRADAPSARRMYLRTLDLYPDAPRLYEALIRLRLASGDRAGALEDLARFERIAGPRAQGAAIGALRRLIGID